MGCQFPENELVDVSDGQTWCRFHLPMTVAGNETPKARWDKAERDAFNDTIFAFIGAAREEQRVADLSGVVFPGELSFEQYKGEANSLPKVLFIAARFAGNASFTEASFGGAALFDKASFGGVALFMEASFGGAALFDKASFADAAVFAEASFGGDASFAKASFGGGAYFMEASFGGVANFSGTGEGQGGSVATFHDISFTGVKFPGPALFNNRKFLDTTNFRGAYFARAPRFHGCALHQDTFFPKEANFRDRSGAEAALAYRTLKHAMANVHARGEEAKFYVLEQKSLLRDRDTPLSTKFFSRLYWISSDYGQSVLCPLLWLVGIFAISSLIYGAFLWLSLDPMSWHVFLATHWEGVLRFSLQQVFQPFQVFRVGAAAPAEAVPDVLRVVPLPLALLAALHSVLTLSFLTLFLLALRRRFKLD